MTASLRLLCLLALSLTLAACSNLHQRETLEFGGDPAAWKAHRSAVAPLTHWTLQGKLGVKAPQESGSGTLFWLQQHDQYDIRLSGPLGRGATRIQGSDRGVTLEIAGHPPASAASAESLLEQQIGWRLPVEHLLWWVKGLPAPDSPSRLQLNPDSQLARLAQAGWTVEYSRYQQVGGLTLPQRLQLSGHNVLLTLVITRWEPRLAE
ncbi:outer membrane lipoprotein LolB [Pseudomonas saudimassiliensis]|uniref:Outer-membrane lipoprotein LolB n=1 Tax=Pseudomonas saudimassiliensis TaxID=1461581 RepID=A0A078M4N3_9PSED|nr:lipoprotein insertase outer membrane protein LolB [Pseudomonas saudimassiliensis]CEA00312.1 outer membrane lipoprotein LolB [Pseudomonas saudimassiliensis]CEF25116.1 outer membrane lipoprotein LolB [Pseudomonas saudimassiliensis]